MKPLSGSAPSVNVSVVQSAGSGTETTDGKQPSKSRQKKFQRHFPQVGPEERVLNCECVINLLIIAGIGDDRLSIMTTEMWNVLWRNEYDVEVKTSSRSWWMAVTTGVLYYALQIMLVMLVT